MQQAFPWLRGTRAAFLAVATVGSGQIAAQACTAVLLLSIARSDGAAAFGATAVYYGVATSLTQLLDWGASTRILRDGGRGVLPPGSLRSLLRRKPAVLACLIPLAALGSLVFGGDPLPAALAVGYAILRGALLVAQALWPVRGATARTAMTTVAERVIALCVGLALHAAGCSGPVAVTGALVVGAVLILPRALALSERDGAVLPVRTVLGFGSRFAGVSVAGNLVLLDSTVLAALAGTYQAGLFAVGARLLGPALFVVTAAGGTLLPAISAGDRAAVRSLRLLAGLATLGLLALFGCAGWLVPLLAGDRFGAAVPALRWYLVASVFVVLAQLVVISLQARGDETAVSVVLPCGVLFGLGAIAAGAVLLPHIAAVAASAGYAVASAAVLLALSVRERGQRQRDGDRDVSAGHVAER